MPSRARTMPTASQSATTTADSAGASWPFASARESAGGPPPTSPVSRGAHDAAPGNTHPEASRVHLERAHGSARRATTGIGWLIFLAVVVVLGVLLFRHFTSGPEGVPAWTTSSPNGSPDAFLRHELQLHRLVDAGTRRLLGHFVSATVMARRRSSACKSYIRTGTRIYWFAWRSISWTSTTTR